MVLMVSEDSDTSDVPVALIDTGCTRCTHGKHWRELFEKRCLHPRGLEVKMTDRVGSFSSAFGKRQEGRVVEIPVALGGRRGVIFSTEMEDCDAPLLVSLASQEALGAVLHLKEMRMELQTLAVDVQLLKVGGRLAVRLDDWGDDDGHRSAAASSSRSATAISSNRDSEFFYAQAQKESVFEESDGEEIRVEEEVGHAFLSKDRGVLATDATGILSKTTRKKLESTWRELRGEDRRLRKELLRPRFEAERFVTADFQTTVVFEPFGGEHILTRYGAKEYGWMQSQPLDVDHSPDYDLLEGPGRALLYRILDLHWPYITVLVFPCHPWSLMTNMNKLIDWDEVRRRRYFLIEQPLTALSWEYDGILIRLWNLEGVAFVRGDQCAYGACDRDTGKPIKKPTGWLTNSAAVANQLSKRCACPPGAHQQLLGKNSGGYRAQQAAAYPVGLAKAFCRGVLQQMQIDYRSSLVMDAAFPVEDAFPHERPRSRSPPRGEPVPEEAHQEGPPLGEDAPPAEAAAGAPEAPAEYGEFELLTVELCAELDTFRSWHRRLLEKMGEDIETIIWGSDLFLEELGGVISEPLKMVKLHAADAPLRMATTLKGDQLFRLDFEDWSQQSLQARRRWLPRHLLENDVVVFYFAGYERGDLPEGPAAAQQRDASRERKRRWELLPRAVKRAIERVHVNLGHPSRPALLRALRLGKATALALKAARLFVCESCRRVQRPSIPRPSQLPRVDELNVLLAMDCFENVDSAGNNWEFLGIMCMGTNFHVVCLLEDTHKNPKASEVRKFYELCWVSWAGQPEEAIMVDRAWSFLGEFADYLEQEGVRLDSAALASPSHIGKMERHDGIWNSMLTRVVHDRQVAGLEEMRTAVTECNRAKNTLARRAGFSPYLWVLGRDVRLPASLADDAEVERVGEQMAAATPGSRFARKVEIRTQCRMAFIQTDTEDRLRRAELRQIRPTRGPFVVGQWVLFYDQAQPAKHRPEHPDNWRGLARVIGHEGRHGVWLAFRGLTVLASPEHLAAATGREIHAWRSIAQEQELVHDAPVSGGSGFVDLRGRPRPPAAAGQEPAEQGDESGMDVGPRAEVPEEPQPASAPPEPEAPPAPPEAEAPRAAPAAPEPPAAPAPAVGAEDVPAPPDLDFDAMEFDAAMQEIMRDDGDDDWHPDSHGVHAEPEPGASRHRRPGSLLEEEETEERREREAKRRRLLDDVPVSIRQGTAGSSLSAPVDSAKFVLDNDLDESMEAGVETYQQGEAFFVQEGIGKEQFIFGLMRNEFEHAFLTNKPGRKEIKLGSLPEEQRRMFMDRGGSRDAEWRSWKDFDAAEPIPPDESEAIRADKANIIIPMRWVDTDMNDGKYDEAGAPLPLLAKSRLVVVGFRDRLLGMFRRDAPTASRLAEALLLTLAAAMGMALSLGDVKNVYFNGQNLQREVYLEQPRGGLPGLAPGQLLRARKAIYGFAEAARLFWLALRDALLSDGWLQSRLEPALFYRRVDGQLKGVAVSHVDDVLVARMKDMQLSDLLPKVLGTFQWKWSELPFTFRGRELSSDPRGFLVKMVNYETSLKPIKIPAGRRKQLQEDLNEDEAKELLRVSGEIGWLGRQCRLDLAFLSGELQRARAAPCVADLAKANLAVSEAKKGAEVALVYPANLRLSSAVIGAAVDAGHANGPEHDDIERYKSCGGHVVLLTTDGTLAGHQAPVAVLDWKSGMTQRVCRSTLAAEASHLADAVEAVDWAAVLFREATNVSVDLLNWQGEVQRLPRFWATDAKSVYDHLTKEGSAKSKDKRMAIEGALLREVYLYKVLREAKWSLVQDPAAAAIKMKKSMQRASRKTAIDTRKTEKRQQDKLVRANEMRDIADTRREGAAAGLQLALVPEVEAEGMQARQWSSAMDGAQVQRDLVMVSGKKHMARLEDITLRAPRSRQEARGPPRGDDAFGAVRDEEIEAALRGLGLPAPPVGGAELRGADLPGAVVYNIVFIATLSIALEWTAAECVALVISNPLKATHNGVGGSGPPPGAPPALGAGARMIKYPPTRGSQAVLFIFRWKGSTFPHALLAAFPCAVLTAVLAMLHVVDEEDVFLTNSAVWSGFSFLVGFLMVFRTSQAYQRFWDGATAIHKMRAEWFDAASAMVAFTRMSKGTEDEVWRFKDRMVRLFSLLHACAILEIEDDCLHGECQDTGDLQLIDPEGLSKSGLQTWKATDRDMKANLVFYWIQALIVDGIRRKYAHLSLGLIFSWTLNLSHSPRRVSFSTAVIVMFTVQKIAAFHDVQHEAIHSRSREVSCATHATGQTGHVLDYSGALPLLLRLTDALATMGAMGMSPTGNSFKHLQNVSAVCTVPINRCNEIQAIRIDGPPRTQPVPLDRARLRQRLRLRVGNGRWYSKLMSHITAHLRQKGHRVLEWLRTSYQGALVDAREGPPAKPPPKTTRKNEINQRPVASQPAANWGATDPRDNDGDSCGLRDAAFELAERTPPLPPPSATTRMKTRECSHDIIECLTVMIRHDPCEREQVMSNMRTNKDSISAYRHSGSRSDTGAFSCLRGLPTVQGMGFRPLVIPGVLEQRLLNAEHEGCVTSKSIRCAMLRHSVGARWRRSRGSLMLQVSELPCQLRHLLLQSLGLMLHPFRLVVPCLDQLKGNWS
ncbi:unnamed protein product [Prorocentrum cordatum]|uniref:Integrase catalytic domain-containing protein n=1 Tax=Prorocentrum cordatum TaxID=2364126 RepID=A0ABN9S5N0_9DINO|nr:unnamed protein product [Polarella glacialis]